MLAPHPYDKAYFTKVLPFPFEDPAHPLGTDEVGWDYLSRLIYGARTSWGKMVGVSGAYVRVYWHLGLFPTLLIALSMLGFSFVGDGLRDVLDPKLIE